ncbi:YeeE/YedE family protein [Christiangramia aquimixticola]|uniref:YeeE/YedE family protein n=1 Tax=Christiangramia aquimixticola TaxID=1697558 RepID=UPI003AA7F291
MRVIGYLFIGIFFGIVMFKSEAASWFRIYEMFQFQAFHMYGIIGSALILGIIGVQLIKKKGAKDLNGETISFAPKEKSFSRYMFGGIIFGLGWALAGACPGPIYTLIGAGYVSVIVVLLAALLGTYIYGLLRDKLPH